MSSAVTPVKIVFMGTASLARPSLNALAQHPQFTLLAVVTQPDKPAGRSLQPSPSPLKEEALQLNLPVLQPERARHPDFIQSIAALAPDLIVVVAYGQILSPALLAVPQFGCLNVHASLLPKFRGAAPIQWAILEGEPATGVTIMQMDAGLDTGPILSQEQTEIRPEDNSQTLHDRLASIGARLLLNTIPDYLSGGILPRPQPSEGATYARKITKHDGKIQWNEPARQILNKIRAFHPWPGAFTFLPEKYGRQLLKIWGAEIHAHAGEGQPGQIISRDKHHLIVACGREALGLTSVQRQGARRLPIHEFLTGCDLTPGDHF